MNPLQEHALRETRRYFFGRCAAGIGTAALASLLEPRLFAGESGNAGQPLGALPGLHHRPTAKRVIWMFMADAPSQLDLFDYKPKLQGYFDKDLPDPVRTAARIT